MIMIRQLIHLTVTNVLHFGSFLMTIGQPTDILLSAISPDYNRNIFDSGNLQNHIMFNWIILKINAK